MAKKVQMTVGAANPQPLVSNLQCQSQTWAMGRESGVKARLPNEKLLNSSDPLPPAEITADSVTTTSVMLNWTRPEGLYASIKLYINSVLWNGSTSISNSSVSKLIGELDPNTEYVVIMATTSKLGLDSANSTEIIRYTSELRCMICFPCSDCVLQIL